MQGHSPLRAQARFASDCSKKTSNSPTQTSTARVAVYRTALHVLSLAARRPNRSYQITAPVDGCQS